MISEESIAEYPRYKKGDQCVGESSYELCVTVLKTLL